MQYDGAMADGFLLGDGRKKDKDSCVGEGKLELKDTRHTTLAYRERDQTVQRQPDDCFAERYPLG